MSYEQRQDARRTDHKSTRPLKGVIAPSARARGLSRPLPRSTPSPARSSPARVPVLVRGGSDASDRRFVMAKWKSSADTAADRSLPGESVRPVSWIEASSCSDSRWTLQDSLDTSI